MRWQGVIASVIVLACAGCATKFESKRLDKAKWEKGEGIDGVIYYEPRLMCVTWKFTAFVKDDVLKLKEPACEPIVEKQEIHLMADLTKPVALIHKPSKFASGSLAVTISDGLLTTLNSVNTPLTADLLGKIAEIGTAAGGLLLRRTEPGVIGPGTACNAAPQIKKIEDVTGKDACSSR